MGRTLHVLVTCSLDETRALILEDVITNLRSSPSFADNLIVVDNASSVPGTLERLTDAFSHVYAANHNVGLWTAVDWALREGPKELGREYDYVYVIESDMIHYAPERLADAEALLHDYPDIGAVRCQEYSIELRQLYDKDHPQRDSRRWAWQSSTNRFTGERIEFTQIDGRFGMYRTNFLTQLPALNRFKTVEHAMTSLRSRESFAEPDFQRACFDAYPINAIIDGGVYHARLSAQGTGTLTGSWTSPSEMQAVGYRTTRVDKIEPIGMYEIKRCT